MQVQNFNFPRNKTKILLKLFISVTPSFWSLLLLENGCRVCQIQSRQRTAKKGMWSGNKWADTQVKGEWESDMWQLGDYRANCTFLAQLHQYSVCSIQHECPEGKGLSVCTSMGEGSREKAKIMEMDVYGKVLSKFHYFHFQFSWKLCLCNALLFVRRI